MPWDCSDWTAYVHDDRTTVILETLAENRGKALYCGVDQSDTFTKAETWVAGRDRNERDDTVYFGENGNFRGFIAAQEGWLTDGESGITGQSTATIFEFPRPRRRVTRTKRLRIANDAETYPINNAASCHNAATNPGDLVCSNPAGYSASYVQTNRSQRDARNNSVGLTAGDNSWTMDWRTNAITGAVTGTGEPSLAWWQGELDAVAKRACAARGYRLGRAAMGPGHNGNQPASGIEHTGNGLGWFLEKASGNNAYRAWQSRTWSATCVKKVRRTR